MATVGSISVEISADLAPLRKAQGEAKKIMGEFDKALSASAKTVDGAFGTSWAAQVGQFNASAKTMTGNVSQVASSLEKVKPAADKAGQAVNQYNGFIKNSAQFSQQAAFQFNDLFVQLASGQSAFTAITQQGAQLSQMFAPGTGLGAAAKQLGASFAQFLINPLNLAVVAIASVAGAIPLIWDAINGGEGKKAEDVLKNIRSAIEGIEVASPNAARAVEAIMNAAQGRGTLLATLQMSRNELQVLFNEAIKGVNDLTRVGRGMDPVLAALRNQVSTFLTGIKAGTSTVAELRDTLSQVYLDENSTAEMRAYVKSILDATTTAGDLERNIKAADAATRELSPAAYEVEQAFSAASVAIDGINDKTLREKLQNIIDDFKTGKTSTEEFKTAVNNLSGLSFENGAFLSSIQGIIDRVVTAKEEIQALSKLGSVQLPTLGTLSPLGSANGVITSDQIAIQNDNASRQKSQYQLEQERLAKRGGGGGSSRSSERDKDYLSTLQSETQFLQQQLNLMGMSYDERQRALQQLQLEKSIREGLIRLGEKATPAQKAAVTEQITLQAQYNEELRKQEAIQQVNNDAMIEAAGLIGTAINGAITGTQDLKTSFLNLAVAIAKAALEAEVLKNFTSSTSGTGGIIMSLFSGLAGARADGGPVSAGSTYLVGERGPELFTANKSGVIVPNHNLASGSIGGGGSSGTTQSDVRVWVDQDGNWQAAVERISAKASAETTRQGIREYDRNMPYRLKQLNKNPNLV